MVEESLKLKKDNIISGIVVIAVIIIGVFVYTEYVEMKMNQNTVTTGEVAK